MSGCPTGTEVGIAWLSTLCQTSSSGSGDSIVSGTAVSTAGRTEWQVVSHEIGHNFGAIVSLFRSVFQHSYAKKTYKLHDFTSTM